MFQNGDLVMVKPYFLKKINRMDLINEVFLLGTCHSVTSNKIQSYIIQNQAERIFDIPEWALKPFYKCLKEYENRYKRNKEEN